MRINISLFLFVYSILALASAYTSQYVFDMKPCILCLYQRWPFFAIILISGIALFIKKSQRLRLFLIALCGVCLLIGGSIAFFHVGVEQGRFQLNDGCVVSEESTPSSIEEMTTQLMGKPTVPCDKPQFVFMGLSMAGWNFLFSMSLGFITLIMTYRMYNEVRLIRISDEVREKRKKNKK